MGCGCEGWWQTSTVPGPRGKLKVHHSTGAARMCPGARHAPWEHVTMSPCPHCMQSPLRNTVPAPWGSRHAWEGPTGTNPCPPARARGHGSACALRQSGNDRSRDGRTDGHAVLTLRTPRTPMLARGGGVLSISRPAEPSHPQNTPRHHRLPQDRARSSRRIPAPKFGGQWGGEGTAVGEDTHLRCIQGPSRIRAARPQPSIQPAGPRGGTLPYHQAKIPPTSLPLLLPSPEEGNSPPHRCPVYQELVPSTRENSRSISRPCFHSADTHYL